MRLSGWGNFPVVDCRLVTCRGSADLQRLLGQDTTLIPRGNGRAYGDAALNPELTVSMLGLDRFLSFDAENGRLTCEAGVLLRDLLAVFVPRGWFPAVAPGTKFVTIGGMVAADVHGKNHHLAGSFARYVEALELALADGSLVASSRHEHPELFAATLGGMGLTGLILTVTSRLIPIETAYIRQETFKARDLAEVMEHFETSADWTYSVAWVDCLASGQNRGRGLFYRGEHASRAELPAAVRAQPLLVAPKRTKRVPVYLPGATLNGLTVRAFNALYYRLGAAANQTIIVDYDTFFFPLDNLLEWYRIYGRRGLAQYQCVLPKQASRAGLRALLERVAKSGEGSFLAVLKLFGPQEGLLSFPMEGYTLALDFPVRTKTLNLLDELDEIVAHHGGRVYLAKDARMKPMYLERGYPALGRFRQIREEAGAHRKFESALSRRLEL